MKIRSKLLIPLISAILGMVGCQRSDMMAEPNGDQIKFSPYIGKSGTITKGTPLTAFTVGDNFKIFAFDKNSTTPFFNDVTVTLLESNTWAYNPVKVWPKDEVLDFYAYSPVGNSNIKAEITKDAQSFQLTVPEDVSLHADLIAAGNLELTEVDVPLTFKHITSRVDFKVTKDVDDSEKQKVRVKSIKIDDVTQGKGLIANGTFTVTDVNEPSMGTWELGNTTAVYEPELTSSASTDLSTDTLSLTKEDQSMFLIPQTLANKELVVDYDFSVDGGSAWTNYVAHIDLGKEMPAGFEQGKKHVLILSIKPSRTYSFTTAIKPWDSDDYEVLLESPSSIDQLKIPGTPAAERFVITDKSKQGYKIIALEGKNFGDQPARWLKVGSKAGLSFADAKDEIVYVNGTPRAVGDLGDPAQDWYIYATPNASGVERRALINVKFNNPLMPMVSITVIQAPGSKEDNPIKASNTHTRIYSASNSTFSGLELCKLTSSDVEQTKGAKITVANKMTLVSPSNTYDITATETPVIVNLAADFGSGTVSVSNGVYTYSTFVKWDKNTSLPSKAHIRAISGTYVKAEIVDPGSVQWCKISLNLNGSSSDTKLSSDQAAPVYLVADENPDDTERRVAIKLTNAAGDVIWDYYTQDPSSVSEFPITADVGTVFSFAEQISSSLYATLKSSAAFPQGVNIVSTGTMGLLSGGGNWKPGAAGQTRNLIIQFISSSPEDNYITLSASGYASKVISSRFGPSVLHKGEVKFIPGVYNKATIVANPDGVTFSEDGQGPGQKELTNITNTEGVYIHFSENKGSGNRTPQILLTNTTDWAKSTRVWAVQSASGPINHNADFTGLAHPVQFAGSNIYINEAGEPTFDDVGVTTHSKYIGVYFRWGGLLPTQPTMFIRRLWKPKEYTGTDDLIQGPHNSWSVSDRGGLYPSFSSQVATSKHNPAQGKGDICRYMTENGLAPVGKKWRIPTAMEFSYTAREGVKSVFPAGHKIPPVLHDKDRPRAPAPVDATDLGRLPIEAGVIVGGAYFPSAGFKYGWANGNIDMMVECWTASASPFNWINVSLFGVHPETLFYWNVDVLGPYIDSEPHDYGYAPVRCIVDEDNVY